MFGTKTILNKNKNNALAPNSTVHLTTVNKLARSTRTLGRIARTQQWICASKRKPTSMRKGPAALLVKKQHCWQLPNFYGRPTQKTQTEHSMVVALVTRRCLEMKGKAWCFYAQYCHQQSPTWALPICTRGVWIQRSTRFTLQHAGRSKKPAAVSLPKTAFSLKVIQLFILHCFQHDSRPKFRHKH